MPNIKYGDESSKENTSGREGIKEKEEEKEEEEEEGKEGEG